MRASLCYELTWSAEITFLGRLLVRLEVATGTWEMYTVSTTNSGPMNSASDILLRQHNAAAHDHKS
jgi:hypothetical protein